MSADTFSIRRTAGLSRWNAVLLMRNPLTVFYAVAMPLLPLLLLLTGDRGSPQIGASTITTVFLVVSLFPVYYNVLAQFVSRRDELVLKRLRTGQSRDAELLTSIAMPGVAIALGLCVAVVPLAAILGQSLPVNVVVYAAAALGAAAMFVAFAYWTAAWTRNAEAAQLTSLPIILVASVGPVLGGIPGLSETVRTLIDLTPGGALGELIRVGWFGLATRDATEATLSFGEAFGQAGGPLLAVVAWTAIGWSAAKRSMRWEPRS